MMRSLLFFLLIICLKSEAQTGYSILYEFRPLPEYKESLSVTRLQRLVFNDTASYYYGLNIMRHEPLFSSKNTSFGKTFVSHSWYYFKNADLKLQWNRPDEFTKPMFVYDTSIRFNWILNDKRKMIAGYNCEAALSIDKNNDSTLAFYTTELLPGFGPDRYTGLPGTILEIYDQKMNWHMVAISVNQGTYNIVLPKKTTILSIEELRKKSKKKSKH